MSEVYAIPASELDRLKNIESMLKLLLKEREDEIDVEEAARICKLTKRTIYNYMDTGKMKIPHEKRGKGIVFKRADVEKWNKERTFRVREKQ
jgi:excisionase family DNA binding protein